MSAVLVDSNILLDVLTEDPRWFSWSSEALARCADESGLVINPIVYAEVSIGFDRIEDVESALPQDVFVRSPLPWDAGFLAGKCFQAYRRRGERSVPRSQTSISAPTRRCRGSLSSRGILRGTERTSRNSS